MPRPYTPHGFPIKAGGTTNVKFVDKFHPPYPPAGGNCLLHKGAGHAPTHMAFRLNLEFQKFVLLQY
jgi:hypothetical protein